MAPSLNCGFVGVQLVFFFVAAIYGQDQLKPPKFAGLPTIDQLARAGGEEIRHYLVETEDGYLVWMSRIGNRTGTPVLFLHGALYAADVWLTRWNRTDLVYMLLDEGYDVYLGNFRGNCYSKFHTKWKSSDLKFWNFSFHEKGYYDVPAMIDKIIQLRGTKKIFYVGHSLGTTSFFVMCATRPEYNAKIKAAMMIAPAAVGPDPKEIISFVFRFGLNIRGLLIRSARRINWVEFLPRSSTTIRIIKNYCGYKQGTQEYCLDLIGFLFGENRGQVDRKWLPYHFSFFPAGLSMKTVYHVSQNYETSDFQYMDYGPKGNMRRYNSTVAPRYPLDKVTAPVALFWSLGDSLVSSGSVMKLMERLPNVIWKDPIRDPKFSHADFVLASNAKEVLYDDVMSIVRRYD